MAAEVGQALAVHAQQLLDQAAGETQAVDQVEAELEHRFARLLVTQVRLRKALADPGCRSYDAEPCSPTSAAAGSSGRPSSCSPTRGHQAAGPAPRDFPSLLAALAAMAAFTAADQAGQLDQLEASCSSSAPWSSSSRQSRSALTNSLPSRTSGPWSPDLLQGRVSRAPGRPPGRELYEGHDRGHPRQQWAEAAAARRNQVVAEVRSAVDDAQRAGPGWPNPGQVLGKPVVRKSRWTSYFGLSGRQVGDELFDGSVRSRLEQAREALGVA